jgi:hypothetical protein
MGAAVLTLLAGHVPRARADFTNVDPRYISWNSFSSAFGNTVPGGGPVTSQFYFSPPVNGQPGGTVTAVPKGQSATGQIVSAVYSNGLSGRNQVFAYLYQIQVSATTPVNDVFNLQLNWYSPLLSQNIPGYQDFQFPTGQALKNLLNSGYPAADIPTGDGNGQVYQITPLQPGTINYSGNYNNGFPLVNPGSPWPNPNAGGTPPSPFSYNFNSKTGQYNIEDTEDAGGVSVATQSGGNVQIDFLSHNPAQSGSSGVLNAGDYSAILVFFSPLGPTTQLVDPLSAHINGIQENLPPNGLTPSVLVPGPEPTGLALLGIGAFGLMGLGVYRRLRLRHTLARAA